MRANHVPMRTCVACRTRRPKAELLRMVCPPVVGEPGNGPGGLVPDPEQRLPGRGIYVCADGACLENPSRLKRLGKHCKGDGI